LCDVSRMALLNPKSLSFPADPFAYGLLE